MWGAAPSAAMAAHLGGRRPRGPRTLAWRARAAGLGLLALAGAALAPCRCSGGQGALAYAVPGTGASAVEVEGSRQAGVAKAKGKVADPYKQLKQQKRSRKQRQRAKVGDRLRGWVAEVKDDIAYVNCGLGRPATLAAKDALPEHLEPQQAIPVWIKEIRPDRGVWLTSIKPRRSSRSLREGEQLKGTVTHLADFGGAFVDVGTDKRGLLHVRDMAEGWVDSVTDMVAPGQEITVWVREVRKDGDFTLNMYKPRIPLKRLRVGMKLQGTVRTVTDFGGAFVDVGAERDGLLTSRAMSDAGVVKVEPGQELDLWIREVREEKDFQLVLKKPRLPLGALRIGSQLEGKISGICSFGGFFVNVGAMRDGVVNANDVSVDMENGIEGEDVTVWVKQVRGDQLQLTMQKPGKDVFGVKVGQKIRGRVTGISKQGGVFVDIGAPNDALLRKDEIPTGQQPTARVAVVPGELAADPLPAGGSQLTVGQEIDCWVKAKHRDKKIDLTMMEEEAKVAEDAAAAYLKGSRGIV